MKLKEIIMARNVDVNKCDSQMAKPYEHDELSITSNRFTWNANIITHNLYQRAVDIAYEARLDIQKTKVLIQKNKNTSKNIQRFGVIERRKTKQNDI